MIHSDLQILKLKLKDMRHLSTDHIVGNSLQSGKTAIMYRLMSYGLKTFGPFKRHLLQPTGSRSSGVLDPVEVRPVQKLVCL